jgi:hypothetical protein
MRDDEQNRFPIWLGGILLGLMLILISTRGGGSFDNPALTQRFAPRPTDPNAPTAQSFQLPQVNLPDLPPEMRRTLTNLRDRLAGGEAVPALTPVATGPRLRIEVQEIKRSGDRLKVIGSVSNIADRPVTIPPGAFAFRDSAGVNYATTGTGGATLQSGASTSFDLSVPLPADRGLALIVSVPPDPPLEQVLVVETKP